MILHSAVKRRRQSDLPLVGADCLDLDQLYIAQTLKNYDQTEHRELLSSHKHVKELYKKLKFSFQELEAKRLFLEALQSVDQTGEGLPSVGAQPDPQYVALENASNNKKRAYMEYKQKVTEIRQNLREQLNTALELYDECVTQKEEYDKKWDEEMNEVPETQPDSLKTVPETQVTQDDIFKTIIPETQDNEPTRHEISRRLSFNALEAQLSQHSHPTAASVPPMASNSTNRLQQLSHMNQVLGWLTGVQVLDVSQSATNVSFRLQLSGIKAETVNIQVELERAVGEKDFWKVFQVQVHLPNRAMQQALNFDDIIQMGLRMNDTGFILREVEERIVHYLQSPNNN